MLIILFAIRSRFTSAIPKGTEFSNNITINKGSSFHGISIILETNF